MRKLPLFAACAALIFLCNSCSKKETNPPSGSGGGSAPTAKYWAKFKVDGAATEHRSNTLQTGHSIFLGYDQVGGHVMNGERILLDPSIGITIFDRNDSITEQEFLGFIGRTFYFDDPQYYVELNYQRMNPITNQQDTYNYDKDDHQYNISIGNITKIGTGPDTDLQGKNYDIYEVTGAFSGFLLSSDGTDSVEITDGQFFFRWTKRLH